MQILTICARAQFSCYSESRYTKCAAGNDETRPKLAKTANKVALEADKKKDAAEKAVEELKRQLQPKRARTDDDVHEMLAEVDDWDLRDHRQEATRVQNRRNVQVVERLLVQGMLACARARTWIPVEWPTSLGGRLYAC